MPQAELTAAAELAAKVQSGLQETKEREEKIAGMHGEMTSSLAAFEEQKAKIEVEMREAIELDRKRAQAAAEDKGEAGFLIAPTAGVMGADLTGLQLGQIMDKNGNFQNRPLHQRALHDAMRSVPPISAANIAKHFATLEDRAIAKIEAMGSANAQDIYDSVFADQVNIYHDQAQRALQHHLYMKRDREGKETDELHFSVETADLTSVIVTVVQPQLWLDTMLVSGAVAGIPNQPTAGRTTRAPLEFSELTFESGGESTTAPSDKDLVPSHVDITSPEKVGSMRWSYQAEEDAIVPYARELRSHVIRQTGKDMEDQLINGDTRSTGTASVNNDGAASLARYRNYNGLVRMADATTGHRIDASTFNTAMMLAARKAIGKYGVIPSDLFYICSVGAYLDLLGNSDLLTMEKFGPRATILTGAVGIFGGVTVFVSEQLALADDDGRVSMTAADNTDDRVLLVNRTRLRQMTRRPLLLQQDQDIRIRYNRLVASYRHGVANANDTIAESEGVSLLYNIS